MRVRWRDNVDRIVEKEARDITIKYVNDFVTAKARAQWTFNPPADCCITRRWRQVKCLANVFWRRWIREYLPSLQERQKWIKKRRNLEIGDIVLILDKKTPRCSWPLGRILEVHTNRSDGLVRSAKVKTNSSVLVRPVDKIIFLESEATPVNDK